MTTILGAGTAAGDVPVWTPASSSWIAAGLRYFCVTDPAYGAKGDGVTDDYNAILAAYAAAAAAGGGIVYFPHGTYLCTAGSVIAVPAGVSTVGADKVGTWVKAAIEFNSNQTYRDITLGITGHCHYTKATVNVHDVSCFNVRFRGGDNHTGANAHTIVFFSGRAAHDFLFEGCDISGEDHDAEGVTLHDRGLPGTANYYNITFHGCHFYSIASMGFEIQGDDGYASTVGFSNINLLDNVFEVTGSELISYGGKTDTTGTFLRDGNSIISGNIFKGAGNGAYIWRSGIEFGSLVGILFTGNYVGTAVTQMLTLGNVYDLPESIVIADNVFDGTAHNGITHDASKEHLLLKGKGIVFKGNHVLYDTGTGEAIYCSALNDSVITGNNIYDSRTLDTTSSTCMRLTTSSNNLIAGNRFRTSNSSGVVVNNNADASSLNNLYCGNYIVNGSNNYNISLNPANNCFAVDNWYTTAGGVSCPHGQFPTVTSLPTAAVDYRGVTVFLKDDTTYTDHVYTCEETSSGVYAWKQVDNA